MLTRLSLRQFALVDSLELEFDAGLCLLTGETGAGKSILVEALGLLAGRRAEAEMVRSGADEATVEGTFAPAGERARDLVRGWGVACDGEVVVRRKLTRGGRSAATVNGAAVTVAQLRELGDALVEIHGQHQGQALLEEESHRAMLDATDGVREPAQAVLEAHGALQAALLELRELRRGAAERERRLDAVRFQIGEIDRVGPRESEEEELRALRSRLRNASAIAESASALQFLLRGEEASADALLAGARRHLQALAGFDPEWEPYGRDLEQAAAVLAAIGQEAERAAATVAHDPQALERAEERLSALEGLRRKYGPEPADVLAHRRSLGEEEARLTGGPTSAAEAQARVEDLFGVWRRGAGALSKARAKAAAALGRKVEEELRPLALEKARFAVTLTPRACGGPEEARGTGLEEVAFAFSANPGEPLKPLAKIASGGELSRAMLALLSALRIRSGPGAVVFDEVDAGIGGRPAEAVGRRLKGLAGGRQVLCITHLPQIAAYADRHIRVEKRAEGGRTAVHARALQREERVEELARMLAGERITDTARRHAEALLKAASAGA